MKIHNELEVQKWALIKIAKEMAKVQQEKKELLTINYVIFLKKSSSNFQYCFTEYGQ